jgi:hypothetical protein
MDTKKQSYEAPSMMVVAVKMETQLLDASLNATREGYGAAQEEEW